MDSFVIFDNIDSSAISKIKVNFDTAIVEITYQTNTEKVYEFYTDEAEFVCDEIRACLKNGESIGKLIHKLKKMEVLEVFQSDKVSAS